ncbi:MAG: PD40 domain-containing protein [Ardenticatenaceae bacterium]|nr:PD40 domain-containing protein [Ardenticatenaceae bacterium]
MSRFDKIVFTTLTAVLLTTLLLIWRGDQVGLQIVRLTPASGSQQVSTQATVRVTFSQEMAAQANVRISSSPPLSGTVRWESGRTLVFAPAHRLTPDTTYTLTIPAGLAGQRGRELLRPFTFHFRTGQPRLLYIAWDESRSGNQLYTIAPAGGTPQPLSPADHNVLDYTIAPDGQTIAYTALRTDGGSDLWLIAADGTNGRSLLACPEGACSQVTWSADSRRLIYERRTFLQPGAPVGPPRLWWLDVNTRETTAVFQDSQWIGLGASLSPDGQWLSYVTPQTQEIQIYNLSSGQNRTFNSGTGEPPAWSPDSSTLMATQVVLTDDAFAIHLVSLAVSSGEMADLSSEFDVTDSWPTFAPDGQWVAFTRKGARANEGKQVWLMRPDGTETQNLTNNPAIHYGPPDWSPDGRYLTFQGYSLSQPDQLAIWLYDLNTGQTTQVTTPGIQPNWLP